MSSIIELPQKVREAKENIIIHSILIGNLNDFNLWFDRVKFKFNCFDGVNLIGGFKVELFFCIFDIPARAKAVNQVGHTCYNACINCLCVGEHHGKIVYPFSETLPTKTSRSYKRYFKNSEQSGQISLGIKGFTRLNEYINVMKIVLYDFMHLCCEGYTKRFLKAMTETCNHKEEYYLGNYSKK